MTEVVVDEWLVEYLSPSSEAAKVELAHAFTLAIKTKCDKMIFSPEHLKNFKIKVRRFREEIAERYYYPLVLKPLTLLFNDSAKAELRSGRSVNEITAIPEDDIPLVESALAIATNPKLIITTDERLAQIITENLAQYGLECINPDGYVSRVYP